MIQIFAVIILSALCTASEEFCYKESDCNSSNRYLLYDVNSPEGFNLRRDVYVRLAVFAHKIKNSKSDKLNNFKLVLPPWSHLVHWNYSPDQQQLPWHLYFDIDNMKRFAPVIEMFEFFSELNTSSILMDEVYILQNFKDMFETGNFEDRMQIDKCNKNSNLNYWFYQNISSNNVKCLSYHGGASKLNKLLIKSSAKTLVLHHAEIVLHDVYGDRLYWEARRSMRFNKELKNIAKDFRNKFLHSNDEEDNTSLPEDYRSEKPRRDAKGGPYLAVHVRRRDFVRNRSDTIPTIDGLVTQIFEKLHELLLSTVFISTDATKDELKELKDKLTNKSINAIRFIPSDVVENKFRDGGIAIIDQIICSNARYFIGTDQSTFTFRIFEEREILGFPAESTFNSFCGKTCDKPSVWKIIY